MSHGTRTTAVGYGTNKTMPWGPGVIVYLVGVYARLCTRCYSEIMQNILVHFVATQSIYPQLVPCIDHCVWCKVGWLDGIKISQSSVSGSWILTMFSRKTNFLGHENVPSRWYVRVWYSGWFVSPCALHPSTSLDYFPRCWSFWDRKGMDSRIIKHGLPELPGLCLKLCKFIDFCGWNNHIEVSCPATA
jgi:hypothetical protein